MDLKHGTGVVVCALLVVVAAGYGSAMQETEGGPGSQQAPSVDCDPSLSETCAKVRLKEGRRLFDVETFDGNGRRCRTCHIKETGTFSPEDVQKRLTEDPSDPLFVHDGLDDGVAGIFRITEHATVRIEILLPSYVSLAGDSERRSVILNRGTPTTMNTPALDRLLMYDTREPDLQRQALGAIRGHAQNTTEPTALELDLIKEFQQTDGRFFSSEALREFAKGGPPPQLPPGTTASEKRGRAMFDPPFDPVAKTGLCRNCHFGPMLNQFAPDNTVGGPPFGRRANIGVSERNLIGNPVYSFVVTNQNGSVVTITSPDPGVMLTFPLPLPPPGSGIPEPPRSFFANVFKIPTLWGVSRTAPYFHDNSAKTLEDVAEHYAFYFADQGVQFNEQDRADMVAFMKLLR